MLKQKMVIIGLIIVLAVSQVYAATLFGGKQGDNRMQVQEQPGMRNMVKDLNLNKEQLKILEDFRLNTQKEVIKINAVIKEKQLDLNAELRKDKIDQKKIDALINLIGKAQTDLLRLRVNGTLKFKSVLTAEQREKLLSSGMFNHGMMGGQQMRSQGNSKEGRAKGILKRWQKKDEAPAGKGR
ncbi:MAG: periplasmic heavy metal sensor [Candidatus Margulisiibacteriota bacterium]